MTGTASIILLPRFVAYDQNGAPLAGGFVATYLPNSTTSVTTWQDPNQATPNAQPVPLDAAGSALIYYDGSLTIATTDALGNAVAAYSGLTTSTSSSSTIGPVTPQQFGAAGDGVTDDSAAVQSAINLAASSKRALYLPGASVGYLIKTPLNMTNLQQLLVYGDGPYPCVARITPSGGSVLIGATGAGKPVIDATGSNGVEFKNFTIASIGITDASTLGVLHGDTTTSGTGTSCVYEDMAILLPASGTSCAVYGVSANLLVARRLMVISDYCIYGTDTNRLSITPPYGTFGMNIQSDGWLLEGCQFLGYGSQIPLIMYNVACHQYDQLYIANLNGGSAYAGVAYAMELNGATSVRMKVEVDYFPCAVLQGGFWYDVDIVGTIYQSTTPVASSQPSIAALEGQAIYGGQIAVRGITDITSGAYAIGTASSSPTLQEILGTSFIFDTAISPNTAYLDFTGSNSVLMFNVTFNGNTDSVTINSFLNGTPLTSGQYRLWINGLRVGTA